MSYKDTHLDAKVYVGELGYGSPKQELEDAFSRYGRLKSVWVARNPPGFAFIEFEDPHDAEDSVKALDGTKINGRRVRVEMSSGKSRWKEGRPPRRGRGGYGGWSGRDSRDSHDSGRRRSYNRSRSRSRSPLPYKRRSRSRSRSRSSSRDRSRGRDDDKYYSSKR